VHTAFSNDLLVHGWVHRPGVGFPHQHRVVVLPPSSGGRAGAAVNRSTIHPTPTMTWRTRRPACCSSPGAGGGGLAYLSPTSARSSPRSRLPAQRALSTSLCRALMCARGCFRMTIADALRRRTASQDSAIEPEKPSVE
jgi:hypothetical protein